MFNQFEKSLDIYYNRVYTQWRINKERAGKDIVGAEYQKFRSDYYMNKGYELGPSVNVMGSGVNTDTVVLKNGIVKIIEEDKGSYLDKTFLVRAIMDAAKIFSHCLKNNLEIPYFLISSLTKMENFDEVYREHCELLRPDIKQNFDKKFKYLPLCDHGRVAQNIYFKTEKNHFKLCSYLYLHQEKIINKIMN
jgi:hypothetical protein